MYPNKGKRKAQRISDQVIRKKNKYDTKKYILYNKKIKNEIINLLSYLNINFNIENELSKNYLYQENLTKINYKNK